LIQHAMEKGALQAGVPETTSDMLWAMMHGIVSMSIEMPMFDKERTDKLIQHAMEMIYRALHV
jgi:hypothetical protein